MRLLAVRHLQNGQAHIRVTNQIFPTAICIPMSREMTITQWHVPVDDQSCYWYSMFTSFGDAVNKSLMREQRLREHTLPFYKPVKNAQNNYGYDPVEQLNKTYTGMGLDINVHDQWAVESPGSIQDRTKEHLGKTDVGIIRYRKRLRAAIEAVAQGKIETLPMMDRQKTGKIRGPVSTDAIADTQDYASTIARSDETRRCSCGWDATL